jgi:uncharacterized caspase-like protein
MRRVCTLLLVLLLPLPAFADGKRPPRQAPGDLYVLAIGVNAYPGKDKLEYAVKDARDLEQAFQQHSRSVFRNVATKLLTNRRADRAGILQGLEWLKTETKPEDVAVIFYSGHGGNDRPAGFYLVPAGYDDRHPRKTMVSGKELREAVKAIRGRVLLLLDCCSAGAVLAGQGAGPRPARLTRELDGHGVMVLCAARPRETAAETSKLHHGLLTRALLEALRGKADANNDGTVTAGELDEYVVRRVRQLSKDEQHAVAGATRSIHALPLARP